jgi:hypothetical protein
MSYSQKYRSKIEGQLTSRSRNQIRQKYACEGGTVGSEVRQGTPLGESHCVPKRSLCNPDKKYQGDSAVTGGYDLSQEERPKLCAYKICLKRSYTVQYVPGGHDTSLGTWEAQVYRRLPCLDLA